MVRSVVRYRTTAAPSGNAVGKSHLGARVVWWFATTRPGARVVVAAPTLAQLSGVLWDQMEQAYKRAADQGIPLGGKLRRLEWDAGDGWKIEGFGSGSVEAKSGRHAGNLLVVIDEASGVPRQVLEALDSLNPSRYLYLGNPLRPEGQFYEVCELSATNPTVNVVRIPSLESPHIHLERSPVGLADQGFLDDSRAKWGEDSQWWASHILALFPTALADGLLPPPWLVESSKLIHAPAGPPWLGIDLGTGCGGDPSHLVVRDDNGVREWNESNRWDFERTAEEARALFDRHDIDPAHVVFDAGGPGADFDSRLRTVGILGAKPFMGGWSGGDKFLNLRSATAWLLRRRLDPKRTIHTRGRNGATLWLPQPGFALPRAYLALYQRELQAITYQTLPDGRIALEAKEAFTKRFKASPNAFDALMMTFAYPHA